MHQIFDPETTFQSWKTYWIGASSIWLAEHEAKAISQGQSLSRLWLSQDTSDREDLPPHQLFQSAARDLSAGDVARARHKLSLIIQQDGHAHPALWLTGVCASTHTEAVEFFSRALREDNQIGYVYHGRGFALLQLPEVALALKDFDQAVALDSLNPWSYLGKSEALYQKREYNEAFVILNQLDRLNICQIDTPAWRYLRLNLARVCFHRLMYFPALQNLDLLLDRYPDHDKGMYWKAYCHIYSGEIQSGIKAIDRCMVLDSSRALQIELTVLKAYGYQCLASWGDLIETIEPIQDKLSSYGQQMLINAYFRLNQIKKVIELLPSITAPSEELLQTIERHIQTFIDPSHQEEMLILGAFLERYAKPNFERAKLLGDSHLALKRIDLAIECYLKAISLNLDDREVRMQLAQILTEQDELEKALEVMESIAYTDKTPHQIYQQSALICTRMKDFDKAIRYLRKAIGENPGVNELIFQLAQSLVAQYKDSPSQLYVDLTYFEQRSYSLLVWIADGLLALYEFDTALIFYGHAVNLRPDLAQTYLWRSSVYMGQKNYSACIEDLEKALSIDPNYAEAYSQRAAMRLNQGNIDPSIESDLHKALSINPESLQAFGALGVYYLRQKDLPKAEEFLNQALQIAPETDWLYAYLAQVCLDKDRPEEAYGAAMRCLSINPEFEDLEFNYALARILAIRKDREGAISRIQKALVKEASSQSEENWRGQCQALLAQLNAAEAVFSI